MKITWVAVPGLLGLLWIVASTRTEPAVVPAASTVNRDPSESLERMLVEQRQAVSSLTQQVARLTARLDAVEGRTIPEQDDREPAANTPAAHAPPQLSRDEFLAQLEQSFRSEREDPRWARDTTHEIQEILRSLPSFSSAVRSLECRSQRCRLEMKEDESPAFSEAALVFGAKMASVLPTADYQYQDRGDGQRSVVVYFSGLLPPQPSGLATR